MRILANYGYKANGDMYSVTFETIGDVTAAQAPQTVDELFRLAKEAVQRQFSGTAAPAPQPAAATAPQPVATTPAAPANGNGRKPQIKDPALPATRKQIGLLNRLARQKGQRIEDFTDLTMGEASAKIDELMAL
jgi:3-oxoacyl-ACP reductase-like protein